MLTPLPLFIPSPLLPTPLHNQPSPIFVFLFTYLFYPTEFIGAACFNMGRELFTTHRQSTNGYIIKGYDITSPGNHELPIAPPGGMGPTIHFSVPDMLKDSVLGRSHESTHGCCVFLTPLPWHIQRMIILSGPTLFCLIYSVRWTLELTIYMSWLGLSTWQLLSHRSLTSYVCLH